MSSSADDPAIYEPALSKDEVKKLLEAHPIPPNMKYSYGTAGFRMAAELLAPVMVRVGLYAAKRSRQDKAGQSIGVMVTASHNLEPDNGVKISDPNGGMMDAAGEAAIVEIANETNVDKVLELIGLDDDATDLSPALVHVGLDTRSHSEELAELVVNAARAAGAKVINHGLVTTPCLHHCVLHNNAKHHLPPLIEKQEYESGYYELLSKSYSKLLETRDDPTKLVSDAILLVDCACGIGYLALQQLVHEIQNNRCYRRIVATNRPTSGPLNEKCGSEHVQKSLEPPVWYGNPPIYSREYCASLDGDADRIVFFSEGQDGTFILLDGDKIACLFSNFLKSQLDELAEALPADADVELPKLGVVQTAYANGASTAYLKSVLGPENVKIAKTGVKHVHHTAAESFDIGCYFEANGHGTILFGPKFYTFIEKADQSLAGKGSRALSRLKLLPGLVNQAVGDALSDMLLVDAILELQGQTTQDWNSLYQDLPSRQTKVQVKDRTIIRTNENETACLEPKGVQDELDQAASSCHGRAFVRPSGTEDVVRVYAEAPTREQADALAEKAGEIVRRLCGGV